MNIFFTKHAKEMMEERKIAQDEVELAIKSPENLRKKDNRYYARKNIVRGVIEVIFIKDKYIKVLTVYWLY